MPAPFAGAILYQTHLRKGDSVCGSFVTAVGCFIRVFGPTHVRTENEFSGRCFDGWTMVFWTQSKNGATRTFLEDSVSGHFCIVLIYFAVVGPLCMRLMLSLCHWQAECSSFLHGWQFRLTTSNKLRPECQNSW